MLNEISCIFISIVTILVLTCFFHILLVNLHWSDWTLTRHTFLMAKRERERERERERDSNSYDIQVPHESHSFYLPHLPWMWLGGLIIFGNTFFPFFPLCSLFSATPRNLFPIMFLYVRMNVHVLLYKVTDDAMEQRNERKRKREPFISSFTSRHTHVNLDIVHPIWRKAHSNTHIHLFIRILCAASSLILPSETILAAVCLFLLLFGRV